MTSRAIVIQHRSALYIVLSAVLMLCSAPAQAQPHGGAPYATYDLHAGVGFPMGFGAGGRMRLAPLLSVEATVGLLPFALVYTAGLNLHTSPSFDLDPAFSLLAGYYHKNEYAWYTGTLTYGFLSLYKTSLHTTVRGGVSVLMRRASDGTTSFYPAPALEVGLAWGFR